MIQTCIHIWRLGSFWLDFHVINGIYSTRVCVHSFREFASELNEFCGLCTKTTAPQWNDCAKILTTFTIMHIHCRYSNIHLCTLAWFFPFVLTSQSLLSFTHTIRIFLVRALFYELVSIHTHAVFFTCHILLMQSKPSLYACILCVCVWFLFLFRFGFSSFPLMMSIWNCVNDITLTIFIPFEKPMVVYFIKSNGTRQ